MPREEWTVSKFHMSFRSVCFMEFAAIFILLSPLKMLVTFKKDLKLPHLNVYNNAIFFFGISDKRSWHKMRFPRPLCLNRSSDKPKSPWDQEITFWRRAFEYILRCRWCHNHKYDCDNCNNSKYIINNDDDKLFRYGSYVTGGQSALVTAMIFPPLFLIHWYQMSSWHPASAS